VAYTGPIFDTFETKESQHTGEPCIVYSTGCTVVTYDNTTGPDFVALSGHKSIDMTMVYARIWSTRREQRLVRS